MSFTAGLRCDDVHVEVRKKLMQDQVFHPLRTELERNGQANGERKLEDMVHRILKEKSGPTTVLEIFFTDGSAIKFFKQMDAIDKHENFESFLSETCETYSSWITETSDITSGRCATRPETSVRANSISLQTVR